MPKTPPSTNPKLTHQMVPPNVFHLIQLLTLCLTIVATPMNVTVLVNYNHAHYNNTPYLRRLMLPWFAELQFCAEDNVDEPDFLTMFTGKGWFQHQCLLHRLSRPVRTDGILLTNDDIAHNMQRLRQKSLHKIWLQVSDITQYAFSKVAGGKATRYSRWNPWMGHNAARLAMQNLDASHRAVLNDTYRSGLSDLFYLPRRFFDPFRQIAGAFGLVKFPIAFHTTAAAIANRTDVERVTGGYLWMTDRLRMDKWHRMTKDCQRFDYVHGLKLSHPILSEIFDNFSRQCE